MFQESPVVITAAVISSVVGLLTVIGVGVKIVSHLASIDATCEMSLHQFTGLKTEMAQFKIEAKADSDKQWQKLSEHDISIATNKEKLARGAT